MQAQKIAQTSANSGHCSVGDDGFIDRVCAKLGGFGKTDDYVAFNKSLLDDIERFANPAPIRDEDDYRRAMQVKTALCGAGCFAFNHKDSREPKVADMESQWGRRMQQYNRRLLTKDRLVRAAIRYTLWRFHYNDVSTQKLLMFLADNGALRIDSDMELFVIGIKAKVGDNLFTRDRKGREHRKYVDTIGRQAFYVNDHTREAASLMAPIKGLPLLDDSYERTSVRDGKGCARPPSLTPAERQLILGRFA